MIRGEETCIFIVRWIFFFFFLIWNEQFAWRAYLAFISGLSYCEGRHRIRQGCRQVGRANLSKEVIWWFSTCRVGLDNILYQRYYLLWIHRESQRSLISKRFGNRSKEKKLHLSFARHRTFERTLTQDGRPSAFGGAGRVNSHAGKMERQAGRQREASSQQREDEVLHGL